MRNLVGVPLILLALLAAWLPAMAENPPELSVLILEGDNIPGVGNVTHIDNLAVNNAGRSLVEADTDFANGDQDQVLILNGDLYLREDQSLPQPPGARLDSFDSMNLSNNGHSGWNLFLDGTEGSSDDSGIYYDTTLVIQESDTSTAPEFTPGTPYIGFLDVKINNDLHMMTVASVDDPNIDSSVDRAIVIIRIDASGNLLAETARVLEGMHLPGQTETVADIGTGPHQSALNDSGEILFFADLNGPTATDGVIYLNDALLAQEGSPSPAPNRSYESLSSRGLDLNNNSDYVFKADMDGDTADDRVIIKNAEIFIREGGSIPAISGFAFTGFGINSGPVVIDDRGGVLWYGEWNDPNTDFNSGLFMDSTTIIQEGITQIDGRIVDTIANGEDAFAISDDGAYAIVEVDFVGGVNGAVLIQFSSSSAVPAENRADAAITVMRTSPNPITHQTVVAFSLPIDDVFHLRVFDLGGRLVNTLYSGAGSAGPHQVVWNGRDHSGRVVPAGTYFASLRTRGQSIVQTLVVVR